MYPDFMFEVGRAQQNSMVVLQQNPRPERIEQWPPLSSMPSKPTNHNKRGN